MSVIPVFLSPETLVSQKGVSTTLFSLRESCSEDEQQAAYDLSNTLGLPLILCRVLACRGIRTLEQARSFLAPTLKEDIPDPSQIKNIDKAAELIIDAVVNGESIALFCDFDVDGLTSAAQMLLFLRGLNALVNYYVPNRFVEGYGLSCVAVEKLARSGTKLLIALDCGATSYNEISFAQRLGLKTVVVDHHQAANPPPPADAFVNPAQDDCPFQEHKLATAGLVWMLLIVLSRKLKETFPEQINSRGGNLTAAKDLIDLAALGTICDMVPLRGINRVIAHRGLDALRQSNKLGIEALKKIAGITTQKRLNCSHISFGIGPRINAAGRIGEAAEVLELLTTTSEKRAESTAQLLETMNEQRRTLEESVVNSCLKRVRAEGNGAQQAAIAVFGEEFHLGVIGIAAQRMVDEFYRPAAIMAPGELVLNGKRIRVIKGSVRGIKGFDVAAALQSLKDHLISCGGHTQAGGFSLQFEELPNFCSAFIGLASQVLTPEMLKRKIQADLRVKLTEIDFALAESLAKLAPFGVGNPSPVFVSENVTVHSVNLLGSKHLRVRLRDQDCFRNAVAWNLRGHPRLRQGSIISLAFSIEINNYQGISTVQLNIRDIIE